MITYKALWETIKRKGINKQYLVDQLGFSKGLMDNLNHSRPITTTTLNDICNKLGCKPEDVITYKKD